MKSIVVISDHFNLDDFTNSETAKQKGIINRYIAPYHVRNIYELCKYVLDNVKEMYPDIKITSGYRCFELNKKVGGSNNSQHMKGQAVDITSDDLDNIWKYLMLLEVDQAIKYNNFIHVSYVDGKNRNQYIDKTT